MKITETVYHDTTIDEMEELIIANENNTYSSILLLITDNITRTEIDKDYICSYNNECDIKLNNISHICTSYNDSDLFHFIKDDLYVSENVMIIYKKDAIDTIPLAGNRKLLINNKIFLEIF